MMDEPPRSTRRGPRASKSPGRRATAIRIATAVLASVLGPLAWAAPAPAPAPPAASASSRTVASKWLPPGAQASPEPSEAIFPPQTLTLRMSHRLHVKELGQPCKVCHPAAYASRLAEDALLPDPATSCDNCHDVDHRNRDRVVGGAEPSGQCKTCHLGDRAGEHGRVEKLVIVRPNLRMNHKAHLDRNIGCPHCHGMMQEVERAARDQLPRMAGCFTCHAKSGSARGEARGECTTCHLRGAGGRLETRFPSGRLTPPGWLHGAAHDADWIARHRAVAGGNSAMCASCHASSDCTDCHDGRARPREVHPGDYLSMHPQAARQDSPRCASCHPLQTFCGDCHRRVGVARDAPSSNRLAGQRFHPAPSSWTTGPRSPQHHSWEAQRNLNACVSCHTERDCASCHATKGLRGGAGVSPHPFGFAADCGGAKRRNPRPCLVCHTAGDPSMSLCR